MEIHNLYHKYLGRSAEKEVILKNPNIDQLENELKNSLEHKIYQRKCNYFKGDKDLLFEHIFDRYIFGLYYQPSLQKLKTYTYWDETDNKEAKIKIEKDIENSSDYKYLQECRDHFYGLSYNSNYNSKKIKYYGPVGTSGYSKICREICELIQEDIDFIPIQFHNYDFNDIYHKKISSLVYHCDIQKEYNYIVLHSTPDLWPTIARYERIKNPNVIIYGITVWETNDIPYEWIDYIQCVDKISTPSEFSSLSFRKYFQPVDTVYHPVSFYQDDITDDFCPLKSIKDKYDYIFYTISEWTNRKGVSELIEIYLDHFTKEDNTLLYIKTFGDIEKDEGEKYIEKIRKQTESSADIILDYKRVSDEYINCIHSCSDCYVSSCKSEGHGIGVCQAMLAGNHTIITDHGGQKEYLRGSGVDFIPYNLEPATFCTTWSVKHQECQYLPHCIHFKSFVPCQQSWAQVIQKDFAYKMKEAQIKKKRKYQKQSGIYLNFRTHFLSSLYSTKIKTANIQTKPIVNWIPQKEIINFIFQKNIIILNASGYGNVGDDLYNYIIEKYFTEENNKKDKKDRLYFVSDYGFIDKEEKIIPSDLYYDNLMDFDFLIIGGGGLLNKERSDKNHSISIYTQYAIKHKKPFCLLSVGFQDIEVDSDYNKKKELFYDYKDLFEHSVFTSLRSIDDYALVSYFTSQEKIRSIHFYPDLVYSLDYEYFYQENERNYLLFVFSEFISLKWDFIRQYIKETLESKNLKLVIMNWNGKQRKNKITTEQEKQIALTYFKDCIFYEGKDIDYDFNELFSILSRTEVIIPGRFHAKVLAHKFNIPIITTFDYHNYKFEVDDRSHSSMYKNNTALIPLEKISYFIQNHKYPKYHLWNENDRNSSIVKINQKTDISISFLQNLTNVDLEKKL